MAKMYGPVIPGREVEAATGADSNGDYFDQAYLEVERVVDSSHTLTQFKNYSSDTQWAPGCLSVLRKVLKARYDAYTCHDIFYQRVDEQLCVFTCVCACQCW